MTNPGWVDLQVNGCLGIDFSDPALTEDSILRAAEHIIASGTDVFLPTIITSPPEVYKRNPGLIKRTVETHGLHKHIPGLHFEGPFLSEAPGAIGAHDQRFVQAPTPENVQRMFEESEGFIRLMTFAAESEGAYESIAKAKALGIVPCLGHHMASREDIQAAADAGAKTLTHLGNGIPNQIDRHHNPIWAGLAEDRLSAMIITDGHHLPRDVVKSFIRCKGVENIIITSDASPAAGCPPGSHHVLGNDAILEPNGKLWNPKKNCLVGSSFLIADCMRYLEQLHLLTDDERIRVGRTNALNLIQED